MLMMLSLAGSTASADANRLKSFLKASAWGTVIGAGVGAVSLAFENKPSDHSGNIARGASLGLYGGIAYGLANLNDGAAPPPRPSEVRASSPEPTVGVAVVPKLRDGHFDGANLETFVRAF